MTVFSDLAPYSTFAVLVLAANMAFADVPRLGCILAQDRDLPRRLAARGERLGVSNGMILPAVIAALLVCLCKGGPDVLVRRYAIGVFVCVALSQAGMGRTRPTSSRCTGFASGTRVSASVCASVATMCPVAGQASCGAESPSSRRTHEIDRT